MDNIKENPQRTILIKVIKPFTYYDEHNIGEIFHIEIKDLSELIKYGYVEVVINENGYNTTDTEYPYHSTKTLMF